MRYGWMPDSDCDIRSEHVACYVLQWECKTDMDNAFRFGEVEVTCEGYDYPDDPYILKGSCGVSEYFASLAFVVCLVIREWGVCGCVCAHAYAASLCVYICVCNHHTLCLCLCTCVCICTCSPYVFVCACFVCVCSCSVYAPVLSCVFVYVNRQEVKHEHRTSQHCKMLTCFCHVQLEYTLDFTEEGYQRYKQQKSHSYGTHHNDYSSQYE